MCVFAMLWRGHPDWVLVAAGNRDERHERPSLPLARWDDGSWIIAGRDAVGGGTWLGVSETGRFAVVTNVRGQGDPDPAKASRGALVVDLLGPVALEDVVPERYNAFNLFAIDEGRGSYLSNRPEPMRAKLAPGLHGLANGMGTQAWPKTAALQASVQRWAASGSDDIAPLFDALRDESGFVTDVPDTGSPIFIRDPVYGTRCSTVVAVDAEGRGLIAERRFDADGVVTGETRLPFSWMV
ncbi:NRDE family protein [Stakelama tenebrarum]|uniref:NRDE family protein n=1 Tax=Stakelama tenebrarum TaxID=2711215 RepID=A0A6G6Y9G6_9SPHN|nr:NRDE family protein [Sphingosinithalassobacter tenebrarum]QIG81575.1 NRDE family protein [Sphingosinithalassobacter tenebrarum]